MDDSLNENVKENGFLRYLFEILLGVSLCAVIVLFVINSTLVNKHHFITKLDENNYYSELHNTIKEEMSKPVTDAGMYLTVLDEVTKVEEVKTEFDKVIEVLFNGGEVDINTATVEDRIFNNIEKFLNETNIKVDPTSIDLLVSNLLDIYTENLTFKGKLEEYSANLTKVNDILTIITIFSVGVLIGSGAYIIFVSKKSPIGTASITLGLVMFAGYFLVKSFGNIESITMYNETLSEMMRNMIYYVLDKVSIVGIVGLIIGIISAIFGGYNFLNK